MRSDRRESGAREIPAWDRSRVQDAMEKLDEGRANRRSFLRNVALAAGTSTAVLATASTGQAASGGKSKLQTLPYQNDPNWVKNHFQNIINNETIHLQTLISELGPFARPKPTFQNLGVTSLQQFVAMGAKFCATGAGAYLGSGPYIQNAALLAQGSSFGQVELAQSAYLYSLLDQPFLPGGSPAAPALQLADVLILLAPYVSSLNGGPEPVFNAQPSPVNDVAIFNVALIQEYLEVEFYTTNFPIIFG